MHAHCSRRRSDAPANFMAPSYQPFSTSFPYHYVTAIMPTTSAHVALILTPHIFSCHCCSSRQCGLRSDPHLKQSLGVE